MCNQLKNARANAACMKLKSVVLPKVCDVLIECNLLSSLFSDMDPDKDKLGG